MIANFSIYLWLLKNKSNNKIRNLAYFAVILKKLQKISFFAHILENIVFRKRSI